MPRAEAPVRQVAGLRTVERVGPVFPAPRLTGAPARGIAYERRVGKFLKKAFPMVEAGQWLRFVDGAGPGCCQPDFFLPLPSQVLIIEAKLTQVPGAEDQLRRLYGPVLERLLGLPPKFLQVFKYLVNPPLDPVGGPHEAIRAPFGPTYTWHYI